MIEKLDKFKNINEFCRSCPSACCGPNINIPLTDNERDFLRSAGTVLFEIAHAPEKNSGRNLYLLESRCGFVGIKNGIFKCSIHENPQRPAICEEIEAGGEICKKIKDSRKVGLGYEFGY